MLNIGIIGAGDMGKQHAKAWQQRNDATIVAIVDPDEERANALAAEYGAQAMGSWQELVVPKTVDAISICAPAMLHHPITVAAAKAGMHVLCEKPMALNATEATAMRAAANAAGTALIISHQYRGQGIFRLIKSMLADGNISHPFTIRFSDTREVRPKLAMHRKDQNGGPVHDMSGHFFDLARWLTGSEATTVTATGHIHGKGKERLASIEHFGIDTADILVQFAAGHTATVHINWGLPEGTPARHEIAISGPTGMLSVVGNEVTFYNADGKNTLTPPDSPDGPADRIDDLVQAINGTPNEDAVDGEAGQAALAITLAALQSIEAGGTPQKT